MDGFDDEAVSWLTLGADHAAAIAKSGKMYTWGSGSYGQLGHGSETSAHTPTIVADLADKRIVHVLKQHRLPLIVLIARTCTTCSSK